MPVITRMALTHYFENRFNKLDLTKGKFIREYCYVYNFLYIYLDFAYRTTLKLFEKDNSSRLILIISKSHNLVTIIHQIKTNL